MHAIKIRRTTANPEGITNQIFMQQIFFQFFIGKKRNVLWFFSLFLFLPFAGHTQIIQKVRIIKKTPHSPRDIEPVHCPWVVPYVYTRPVSLNKLPVKEKKQKFFDLLLPSILVAKTNLDYTRQQVERLTLKKTMTPKDTLFIMPLMKKYRAKTLSELVNRLQTVPVSIVLAQAAIESGWGSSRFFREGNNVFGMWSFDSTENRIPALSHRNGTRIYLQKFNNLEESIDAYFTMLNTRTSFAPFRALRQKTDDPLLLIDSLRIYSERGKDYINDIARLIRVNHLQRYDSCRIDPAYLIP